MKVMKVYKFTLVYLFIYYARGPNKAIKIKYVCMKDDLQLGKLKEHCLLLKLYRKLRKMFLSPRRESNPQPSIPVWGSETFF